jgi:hypothetical protein
LLAFLLHRLLARRLLPIRRPRLGRRLCSLGAPSAVRPESLAGLFPHRLRYLLLELCQDRLHGLPNLFLYRRA